jgi:aminoglycoside 6'-N-acetyltransferase
VGAFIRETDDTLVELGWSLYPAYWGQGFATEAAGAVLDLAFADLGLHRVEARLDARNERSAALCERLGMRQEAHFRDTAVSDGGWADLLVYGLLAREWSGTAR